MCMMTAPSCLGSSRLGGGGEAAMQARGGEGQILELILYFLKNAKIRQLEGPLYIPGRQNMPPSKKLGMSEGPRPSSSVKDIRPSLRKTNVSAV